MSNALSITLILHFVLFYFFLALKLCLNSCETMMDKGYWGEKVDFVSLEYVPKYFHFMNIGKCGIKKNVVSEEIKFLL